MIDTEALRKKVIDLAIRGKLTEQIPTDGTAEELYAQIQKEKESLVQEGKVKKEKPLLAIEADEIPFEIPKSWKWVRLSDISDTNIGLTYHPENVVEHGTVVLRSNNIQNGKFDFSDLVEVNCPIRDNQYLRKNDILICARNGSKKLVGKCAIYNGDLGVVSFGAFMAVLRTPLNKYIYYYLTTEVFRRYYSNDDSKQINQVTQDILKKAIVPLPPLAEQKRIADKIDEVSSEIDRIDALQLRYNNNLEALTRKIIDAGIRGKLTKQLPTDGTAEELYAQIQEEKARLVKEGKIKKEKPLPAIEADEIPFEIPMNWKWVRLAEIVDVRDGTHDSPKYYEAGIPMITSKNLSSGALDFDNVKYVSKSDAKKINERSAVDDGDILFAMIGTIGNPVLIKKDREFVVKNVALFKQYEKTNLLMKYVYWYLMKEQHELRKIASGGLQPFISLKQFRIHLIPLPPLNEQTRIVSRVEEVLAQA